MTEHIGFETSRSCDEGNHADCTGCPGCSCHHVTAPVNFRQVVERARGRVRGER